MNSMLNNNVNQDTPDLKCDVLLVFVNDNEKKAIFSEAKSIGDTSQLVSGKIFTYHDFGDIGGARVLGLRPRMGSLNRGASLTATTEAINDLNPDYIIAVGVAFGMDRKKHRIGDILVSEKIAMYEPQKIGISKKNNNEYIEYHIHRGETAAVPERLYSKIRAMATCWEKAPAHFHFGLILSGEKLIDCPFFKKKLREEYPEAIGGEMEAAGIYASAELKKRDWIIIKAVCDYADGNKKRNEEKNQRLAAQNAACFVFKALKKGLFCRESINARPIAEGSYEKINHPQRPAPQIKEKIKKEISEVLGEKQLKYLFDALIDLIKDPEGKVKTCFNSALMAEILTDYDLLEAIKILKKATKKSLEKIKDEDGQHARLKAIWDGAVNILGWLVLLAVDYDWIERKGYLDSGAKSIKLEIPVQSGAGIEIVYSGITDSQAKLTVDEGGVNASGHNRISCITPEGGWDTVDEVQFIERLIWKKIYKEEPPTELSLYQKNRLNAVLRSRNEDKEHCYFYVDGTDAHNPLNFPEGAVLERLKNDLKELHMVFMTIDESEKVLIISEPDLEGYITEFFRIRPE